MMRRYIDLLTTALLALAAITPAVGLSGCSDSSDPSAPSGPSDPAMAYLTINVSAGSPKDSRANDIPADGNYSDGIAPYEQMYTLRAIIVRPGGIIEHNELLHTAPSGQGFNQYTYASLKVVAGETKTVYLFANEDYTRIYDSTGATTLLKEKLTTLHIGDTFPADEYYGMIISNVSTSQAPLIDNSGDDESKKSYLPMSEVFDVKIESVNKDGTNLYQSADLFITRAAVKFGFAIDPSSVVKGNVRITNVTIHGLADREYLIPQNGTVDGKVAGATYDPAKYPVSSDNRIITAYTCPAGATTYDYTFTMPNDFGIIYNADGSMTFPTYTDGATTLSKYTEDAPYATALYFAESPVPTGGKYTVDVTAEFDTGIADSNGNTQYVTTTFEGITLDNLPNLPRNTFVKIVIKLGETQPTLEAIVQPYTGVWLNPDFGIDRP